MKEGGKTLVITEAKLLSLISQAQGNVFLCFCRSRRSRCKGCRKNLEFVESFERVVIMFDNDKAGIEAAKDVASILSAKAAICTLPLKDAKNVGIWKTSPTD